MSAPSATALIIRSATSSDSALLLTLVKELAEYERLSHKVTATADLLDRWLLGPHAIAHALIAEVDGQPAGYAVFFPYLSTFRGQPGMYLEDIYVRPPFRGHGVGEALLRRVARTAIDRGCTRLEWIVLDWNQPAIDFYQRFGAHPQPKDWTTFSLTGEALNRLTQQNK